MLHTPAFIGATNTDMAEQESTLDVNLTVNFKAWCEHV